MPKHTALRCLLLAALLGLTAAKAAVPEPIPANPLGLRAHHATASVVDIERAVKWYQDVLGFKLLDRGTHGSFKFAELGIPGFNIGLIQLGESPMPKSATPPHSPSWVHIVFAVPDPAYAYRWLQQHGADVSIRTGAPTNPVTTFLVHDSEGNEIEIIAEAGS